MAAAYVKCYYCGEKFDRNSVDFVKPTSNRYAHISCHEKAQYEMPKKVVKERKIEPDLLQLENYIKKLFNYTELPERVVRQIAKFRSSLGYSCNGILKSLIYFYEVKNNDLSKSNGGIGIVPYVYEDAYAYYYEIFCNSQQNKHIEEKDMEYKVIEITITAPKRKPRKTKKFTFLDEEIVNGK